MPRPATPTAPSSSPRSRRSLSTNGLNVVLRFECNWSRSTGSLITGRKATDCGASPAASLPPAPSVSPNGGIAFRTTTDCAAPHFEPPKLAAPRCRCRCRCNKFAPGPLAPRAGPGCVPAWPARWRGARPPPTSPRGAAPGRPGRPPQISPDYYPSSGAGNPQFEMLRAFLVAKNQLRLHFSTQNAELTFRISRCTPHSKDGPRIPGCVDHPGMRTAFVNALASGVTPLHSRMLLAISSCLP